MRDLSGKMLCVSLEKWLLGAACGRILVLLPVYMCVQLKCVGASGLGLAADILCAGAKR
jgi:hypothetical protein